jgi:hypothetical protein
MMPCLALLIALRQQNRDATYSTIAQVLGDRDDPRNSQAAQLMALAHESAQDFEEDVNRLLPRVSPELQLEEAKSVCTDIARVDHKITEAGFSSPAKREAKLSLQSSPDQLHEDSTGSDVPVVQPVVHNASKSSSQDISKELLDILGSTF